MLYPFASNLRARKTFLKNTLTVQCFWAIQISPNKPAARSYCRCIKKSNTDAAACMHIASGRVQGERKIRTVPAGERLCRPRGARPQRFRSWCCRGCHRRCRWISHSPRAPQCPPSCCQSCCPTCNHHKCPISKPTEFPPRIDLQPRRGLRGDLENTANGWPMAGVKQLLPYSLIGHCCLACAEAHHWQTLAVRGQLILSQNLIFSAS